MCYWLQDQLYPEGSEAFGTICGTIPRAVTRGLTGTLTTDGTQFSPGTDFEPVAVELPCAAVLGHGPHYIVRSATRKGGVDFKGYPDLRAGDPGKVHDDFFSDAAGITSPQHALPVNTPPTTERPGRPPSAIRGLSRRAATDLLGTLFRTRYGTCGAP